MTIRNILNFTETKFQPSEMNKKITDSPNITVFEFYFKVQYHAPEFGDIFFSSWEDLFLYSYSWWLLVF